MDNNNTTTPHVKLAFCLAAAGMAAMTMFTAEAEAQALEESLPHPSAVVEPLRPGVTEDEVFAELAARNQQRTAALHDYTALRTYQVVDVAGKVHAEEIGRMEYVAPDKKTFTITSEAGSEMVRHMALNPLLNSEIQAATGKEHHDSTISAENYSLNLLGEQQVGPYRCFVAEAFPKRKDKYLFEGKLWIDAQDYSVVRIDGHPAKKLSFWIQRADFARQYQKIDGFWLPLRDETLVQVRLYGKKVLTIEHRDYVVNEGSNKEARATVPVSELPAVAHIN
jgi:hypothetical protein